MNDQPRRPAAEGVSEILAAADLCVKCGLCLPHCPTYLETRDEGESPRGRIALVQGLLTGRLSPTRRGTAHLDRCLVCRACQVVCPAGVPYGRIIDGARAELQRQRPHGPLRRGLRWLAAEGFVRDPWWLRRAVRLLRGYRDSTLAGHVQSGLGRLSPRLRRLTGYLPPLLPARAWATVYRAQGEPRGEVALFLGCVAREIDRATLEASLRVLTRLGYTVYVPRGQVCCGAMHLHEGAEAEALARVARNIRAFEAFRALPIVVTASGCGATLAEYDRLSGLHSEWLQRARELARRVVDVNDFLAGVAWPKGLLPAVLPIRVAVHEPCSLRNVLARPQGPYRLLERIPGLEVVPLPGNERCCGSAGAYMLTQPKMADRLRDTKLEAFSTTGARLLVTANIGCALHLAAGFTALGTPVEVVHPVILVDRQLGPSADHDAQPLVAPASTGP